MRGAMPLAEAVLIACLLCAPVGARDEFPLAETAAGPEAMGWARWVQQVLPTASRKPVAVRAVPKLAGKALYLTATLGGRATQMLIDVSDTPKLYVDTDGDGDLAEEQALSGKRLGSRGLLDSLLGSGDPREVSFNSVAVKVAGAPAEVKISLSGPAGGGYVELMPGTLRAGTAKLAGRSCRVQIVDANLDGRYGSAFPQNSLLACDLFAMDLNGNGRLDVGSVDSGEIMPLPKMIQVGGAWYDVAVAPDGSGVGFERAEPQWGTLDVGSPDVELRLFSDSGFHWLKGSGGKWKVPVGNYMTVDVAMRRTERGAAWSLECDWPGGKLQNFSVRRDETTQLPAGPPLVGEVRTDLYDNSLMLSFALRGRAGEEYEAGARRNGRSQPAPSFVIQDETGKELASGKFEYG